MQLTMTRTRSQHQNIALVMLALLMGGAGRQRPRHRIAGAPETHPLQKRNGAVVYAANNPQAGDAVQDDSDLFIADQLGGTPRALASGPEI